MLFIESKTLKHTVARSNRIQILRALEEKQLIPVIRSARLHSFKDVLGSQDRVLDMEAEIASWYEAETRESYIPGDIFFFDDHAFFLSFDDGTSHDQRIRAGIVYETGTTLPFNKLDSFCQSVYEVLASQSDKTSRDLENLKWEHSRPLVPEGFKHFIARQDSDTLFTRLRRETATKRIIGASILEDSSARFFLRQAKEAHAEGYAAKLLTGETLGTFESSIGRLEDAGLVEREVQVSCRKTGHALLRLPTPDALAVVTVSDATCSECGSAVADEKVEEVIVPTRLATSLLEDSSWLLSRLHQILRELGIPESEIAAGPSGGEGYGQMMANICGETFLMVARDGDFTPSFARWAIDQEIETEAAHLVVVATGRLHNQAGAMLENHARRRLGAGRDFELILADGAPSAGKELEQAFERVSRRVIAEQVCNLDNCIGLSVSRLIITKYRLVHSTEKIDRPKLNGTEADSTQSPPLALAATAAANAADVSGSPAVSSEQRSDLVAEPVPDGAGLINPESH